MNAMTDYTIEIKRAMLAGSYVYSFSIMDGLVCVAESKKEYPSIGLATQQAKYVLDCLYRASPQITPSGRAA